MKEKELVSIERRIISTLYSALRGGSLRPGDSVDSPYVISSLDGTLMDCNSIFCDLVAKGDLQGTHYRERCPTLEIEKATSEVFDSIEQYGMLRSEKPILGYDGKIHYVSYEAQLIAIGGKAFVFASMLIDELDIGSEASHIDGKIVSLPAAGRKKTACM
tara:strand:- start:2732 stop:3211 length:480 start_codon:yes stop_codon:yes gene_type:complete